MMRTQIWCVLALFTFCLFLTSCEKEEENEEIIPTSELNAVTIDSSSVNKEHNMVWNGRYYFLEFDSAYTKCNGSKRGDHTADVYYYSFFSDRYTGLQAVIIAYPYVQAYMYPSQGYSAAAAQDHLPYCEQLLQTPTASFVFPNYGFQLYLNDERIIPANCPTTCGDCSDYVIDLPHFNQYNVGNDLWADYDLEVSGRCLEMKLSGKLKAQGYP